VPDEVLYRVPEQGGVDLADELPDGLALAQELERRRRHDTVEHCERHVLLRVDLGENGVLLELLGYLFVYGRDRSATGAGGRVELDDDQLIGAFQGRLERRHVQFLDTASHVLTSWFGFLALIIILFYLM